MSLRAEWIEGAKKEGKLIFWGTLITDAGSKVATEFNKIYPFIKVDYWRGKGKEIAAGLEAESVVGTEDLIMRGIELNLEKRFSKALGIPTK